MNIIQHYFPDLTPAQLELFAQLQPLYAEWNAKINVISRKDIDNLYERHILHSLAIAKVVKLQGNRDVVDVGTGGGFPGIPLAIMFPDTHFHLVDSIAKKITVVKAITEALHLDNVSSEVARVETLPDRYDFAITRAVAPMEQLYGWIYGKIKRHSKHEIHNGILALKGGDITAEMAKYKDEATIYPIGKYFKEEFFSEKFVVHLPI